MHPGGNLIALTIKTTTSGYIQLSGSKGIIKKETVRTRPLFYDNSFYLTIIFATAVPWLCTAFTMRGVPEKDVRSSVPRADASITPARL